MDKQEIQNFRRGLLAKRQNLTVWLSSAPIWNKKIRLGPLHETAAETHLQVLDAAIEKAQSPESGLCEVCHEEIETELLEMDYACCVCLDHLSSAEKEQLEFELEVAAKVQQALLPNQVLEAPELEVAAFSRPAAIVGGDYFDFYRFRDGAYGLLIADVAGHGMSASLIMANLQASLRILVPEHNAPDNVVRRLSHLFYHNINMTSFVSLFLARFDPQANELTYCNAGHNPPLLYRPQSNGQKPFSWLRPTGAAIGLAEVLEFQAKTIKLKPGDLLLLYTDGVTEAIDPGDEEFGSERLVEVVQQDPTSSAQEVVQRVRDRLLQFTQGRPLTDDTTIVVYRILEQ
jgi:sigma-B regulation protein RsbU (phosphoserine phosphatase)